MGRFGHSFIVLCFLAASLNDLSGDGGQIKSKALLLTRTLQRSANYRASKRSWLSKYTMPQHKQGKRMGCSCHRGAEEDKVTLALAAEGPILTERAATRKKSTEDAPKFILLKQSRQKANAQAYWKQEDPQKMLLWTKVHFILAIDSSSAMIGRRWSAVSDGYQIFLTYLQRLKDVLVSVLTYDDQVNTHIKLQSPHNAAAHSSPSFTGGTNRDFAKAFNSIIGLISNQGESEQAGYLPCIMFVSANRGGYPEEELQNLCMLKQEGKNFLYFSLACECEDNDDLVRIAGILDGEHYIVTDAEAMARAFVKVIASP